VALLSIGEEKGKGDARIQRATELLDASGLRFVGNVEGKDLPHHHADVVVCDAVLGNVVIKFFEGLSGFIFDLWRRELGGSWRGRLAYLLLRRAWPASASRRAPAALACSGSRTIITHGRARRRMVGFACEWPPRPRAPASQADRDWPRPTADRDGASRQPGHRERPGIDGRARVIVSWFGSCVEVQGGRVGRNGPAWPGPR
jgi:hypothetical protein